MSSTTRQSVYGAPASVRPSVQRNHPGEHAGRRRARARSGGGRAARARSRRPRRAPAAPHPSSQAPAAGSAPAERRLTRRWSAAVSASFWRATRPARSASSSPASGSRGTTTRATRSCCRACRASTPTSPTSPTGGSGAGSSTGRFRWSRKVRNPARLRAREPPLPLAVHGSTTSRSATSTARSSSDVDDPVYDAARRRAAAAPEPDGLRRHGRAGRDAATRSSASTSPGT